MESSDSDDHYTDCDVGQQGNMAEAAVESPAARFFCHRCTQEISPVLPDFICPRCQSGFIEELARTPPEPSEESDEDVDPILQVASLWEMLSNIRRFDDEHNQGISTGNQDRDGRNNSRPGPSRRRIVRYPSRRQDFNYDAARARTEGFLQQLVSTLQENSGQVVTNATFPVFLNLHSNPGDYAWGRGGWNAIITQLINQLDGTGPPPLPKEKIDEIPIVDICQEQVDKNLQCTVCMEDFKKGEPVRRLSCDHHFHNECIIPWLELHGTCPICRKMLNDNSQENVFSNSSNLDVFSVQDSSTVQPGSSQSMPAPGSNVVSNNRSDTYNPHQPSVYDFTDDFD